MLALRPRVGDSFAPQLQPGTQFRWTICPYSSPAAESADSALPSRLQQIGVPCVVLEAVAELKPLGVGINLQPNAVRELYELGIGSDQLDAIGVRRASGRWSD